MKIPVLSNLWFEPSVSVSVATVVTLISTACLGFREIIGSNLEYSKFTNSSSSNNIKPLAKQGIKLSSRTGMLIAYTPALLAGIGSFIVFPGDGIRFFLLRSGVTFHFLKRVFEVLYVHKYSANMGLGSTLIISTSYFYLAISMIVVQHLTRGLPEPSIDLTYIGLIMFIVAIIGNFYHHNLLSKLRTNNKKEYKIPRGGLFNLVICPHYLFEIIMFYGFAFISQTSMAFACAFSVSCYLISRSHQTRKWYANKFEDFPTSIKCVIPYVF